MTTADRWILRAIGFSMIAVVVVVGYEAYTNGEKFKATQNALIASAQSGARDVHSVSAEVAPAVRSLNSSVGKIGDVADQLELTVGSINRPCGTKSACGTLADINKTLGTVRGTFGQIEVAALHQNRQLSDWDSRGEQIFSDTHQVLTKFSITLDGATDTLQHGSATMDSLNAILKDQAIHQTVSNVASMTTTADQVFTKATNNYLHPSKSKAVRVGRAVQPYAPIAVRGVACLTLGVC